MSPLRLRLLVSLTALAIAYPADAFSMDRSRRLTKASELSKREVTLGVKSKLPVPERHTTVTELSTLTRRINNSNTTENNDFSTNTISNKNIPRNVTASTITDMLSSNNTAYDIGINNQNAKTPIYKQMELNNITKIQNTNTNKTHVIDNITGTEGYNSSSTVGDIIDFTVRIESMTSQFTEGTLGTAQNDTNSPGNLESKTKSSVSKQSSSTLPTRKKYIIIDRKRITAEMTPTATEVNEIFTVAPTKNIAFSLEDVYSLTSNIPSLEDLRIEFIAITKRLSSERTDKITTSAEALETSTSLPMLNGTDTTKTQPVIIDQNSSKTGHFQNISSQSPSISKYTKTTDSRTNETEINGNMFELYTDTEGLENRNTSAKSQSQLVDDALKEELLKEEVINNNKENADKRSTSSLNPDFDFSQNEDLTVKPITQENNKNISAYTDNPNYKSMKTPEIQSKQFLRDPDDNSWRNQSLSSLGITFNANNSSKFSKSFTQVLKEKTEAELKNLIEAEKEDKSKENKSESRKRLEKMSEKRKSKKKKFDDNTFSDLEEVTTSGDTTVLVELESPVGTEPFTNSKTLPTTTTSTNAIILPATMITTTSSSTNSVSTPLPEISTIPATVDIKYPTYDAHLTTRVPKRFSLPIYYDGDEQSDVDYITAIDLKRFTMPYYTTDTPTLPVPITQTMRHYLLDRKPTIQYFPPKTTKTVNVNDYDLDFQRKINTYTTKSSPLDTFHVPPIATKGTQTTTKEKLSPLPNIFKTLLSDFLYNPGDLNRELYHTHSHEANPNDGYTIENQADTLEQNAYIIKPFSNYFNDAAQDHDDERSTPYVPTFTQPPWRGVTINELAKAKGKSKPDLYEYDYETQFRKDILERFIDNFKQHNDQYKVDFPIIYNSSVVHKKTQEDGKVVASSSAFLRRLYDVPANKYDVNYKPCDSNCDNVTVELSPAYELHYYVPDQEEKEVSDPRTTLAYNYRL